MTRTEPTSVRADLPEPTRMLGGRSVYRIVWKLNTDVLVGYCWCGESVEADDPIVLWDWLLAHPDGHDDGGPGDPTAGPAGSPDRELVQA